MAERRSVRSGAPHEERYGYSDPDATLELVTIRVAAALPATPPPRTAASEAPTRGVRRASFGGEWHEAGVIGPGTAAFEGPAIVELPGSTLVVPPGWSGDADADGVTLARRTGSIATSGAWEHP